jgi:hypothetical protein
MWLIKGYKRLQMNGLDCKRVVDRKTMERNYQLLRLGYRKLAEDFREPSDSVNTLTIFIVYSMTDHSFLIS